MEAERRPCQILTRRMRDFVQREDAVFDPRDELSGLGRKEANRANLIFIVVKRKAPPATVQQRFSIFSYLHVFKNTYFLFLYIDLSWWSEADQDGAQPHQRWLCAKVVTRPGSPALK